MQVRMVNAFCLFEAFFGLSFLVDLLGICALGRLTPVRETDILSSVSPSGLF